MKKFIKISRKKLVIILIIVLTVCLGLFIYIPSDSSEEPIKNTDKTSEDVATISDLPKNIEDNINKRVTVRGYIAYTTDGSVMLVDDKQEPSLGRTLDLSNLKNQDLASYDFYEIQGTLALEEQKPIIKVDTTKKID